MIEYTIGWILIVLCTSYVILHAVLWSGLNRRTAPNYSGPEHRFSVIIAARNEETTIGPLLQSLAQLEYPRDRFEVIIVNDRSTDSTGSVISSFQQLPNLSMIEIKENTSDMPNKKNALRTAIDRAQFDILVFTDADCTVPATWLKEISHHFTEDVGVVAGYSPYQRKTAGEYLRYEEFKKTLLASSTIGLQYAFLCTGRNFAYRKKVYDFVGGFEKIKHSISGDDDLFLQLVQHVTDWDIRYMTTPESFVYTLPPQSLSQFIHQRTRHISASRYYAIPVQLYYSIIHLFHVTAFVGFFVFPLYALIAVMVKFNIDGIITARGSKTFREEFTIRQFFFFETLLVLYSFIIGPLGYMKKFKWKEAAP